MALDVDDVTVRHALLLLPRWSHYTKYLHSCLDAFDTWALRKILRIPYTRHMSDAEVRGTTGRFTAFSPGD